MPLDAASGGLRSLNSTHVPHINPNLCCHDLVAGPWHCDIPATAYFLMLHLVVFVIQTVHMSPHQS